MSYSQAPVYFAATPIGAFQGDPGNYESDATPVSAEYDINQTLQNAQETNQQTLATSAAVQASAVAASQQVTFQQQQAEIATPAITQPSGGTPETATAPDVMTDNGNYDLVTGGPATDATGTPDALQIGSAPISFMPSGNGDDSGQILIPVNSYTVEIPVASDGSLSPGYLATTNTGAPTIGSVTGPFILQTAAAAQTPGFNIPSYVFVGAASGAVGTAAAMLTGSPIVSVVAATMVNAIGNIATQGTSIHVPYPAVDPTYTP